MMIVFFRKRISDFAEKSFCLFDECAEFLGSHAIVGLRGSSQSFVGQSSLFFRIRISSLVTVIDSYYKTTYFIVSLIVQIF